MTKLRTIPFATLTLAIIVTIIQVFRMTGEGNSYLIMSNLNVGSWELLYANPWRILTSPFIHQNLLHYFENLFFLLLFGWQIERKYGSTIFLGVFFGALITGYVIWINLMHNWIIGISGGVCGLFGFSLIANSRSPWWTTLTHRPLHALYSINLIWSVVVDLADWVPFQVAHLNHVTGILYGLAFAGAFLAASRRTIWRVMVIVLPILLFASQFYSPWQIEWQLVKSQPILVSSNADCQLKSVEQETYVPAPIKFVNDSTKTLAIYWLDYEGDAIFHLWLQPGGSREYNSFVGHPWCIVDIETNEAFQAIIVTEVDQTLTIN